MINAMELVNVITMRIYTMVEYELMRKSAYCADWIEYKNFYKNGKEKNNEIQDWRQGKGKKRLESI